MSSRGAKSTVSRGLLVLSLLGATGSSAAGGTFEELQKTSVPVYDLPRTLRPFVATCERSTTYFRRLFCTALNERLKAQHQSKLYALTVEPSADGPLVVDFRGNNTPPTALISVRGCLTCGEPLLDREGGDISKARFFVFQLPKTVKIRTGRGSRYDLGDLDVATYEVTLPKKMTEKAFRSDVLPHLRLEMLYRPVAGVTKVGGRHKYGFVTFELAGHRVYNKCTGEVHGATPPMKGKYRVDKSDWTCPQNRPKVVKGPKLPSRMPKAQVKALMDAVAADLHTCYDRFGLTGAVPAELEVTPTGKVKSARVAGKLAKTEAARCVEHLLKNVKFPSFSGDVARLRWPFVIEK